MPASQRARNRDWSRQLPPLWPPSGWSGRAPPGTLFLHSNSPPLCSPPSPLGFLPAQPPNRVTGVPYTCLTGSAGHLQCLCLQGGGPSIL